ncbi:MAG: hypothetical protein HQ552_03860 [Desulfobacteraceae bacterium]|nr:hypothetical protein [Desulfobacteraceae bacterium]
MADKWFEKLKMEVDSFIKSASDNEIEEVFTKAKYNVYKHIKTPIIEHHYNIGKFLYKDAFSIPLKEAILPVHTIGALTFTKFSKADEYDYCLAA